MQAESPLLIPAPTPQDRLKQDGQNSALLPVHRTLKRTCVVLVILSLLYLLQQVVYPDLDTQNLATAGSVCGKWQTTTGPRLAWQGGGGFYSVSAISPNDVWAGGGTNSVFGPIDEEGAQPIAMHWDGKRWQEVSTPKPGDGSYFEAGAAI